MSEQLSKKQLEALSKKAKDGTLNLKDVGTLLLDLISKADKIQALEAEVERLNKTTAQVEAKAETTKAKAEAFEEETVHQMKDISQERKAQADLAERQHVRIYHLEARQIAGNLIIRGLPESDGESKKDVAEVIGGLLSTLGCQETVKVADAYRFKKSMKSKSTKAPPILVKLEQAGMKALIFKNVGKIESSKYQGISIANQYPASIKADMAVVEKTGYEIRQANRTTKTKVEIYQGRPYLLIKKAGETEFKYLD